MVVKSSNICFPVALPNSNPSGMLTTRELRSLTAVTWIEKPGWDGESPKRLWKEAQGKMLMTGLPLNRKQASTPPGDRGGGGALRLPTCPRSPRRQTARGPPDSSATAGSPWREQHRDGSASRPNGLCANARLRTVQWPPRPTRAPRAGTTHRTPGRTSAPTGSPAPERKLCSRRKSRLARGLSPGNWASAEIELLRKPWGVGRSCCGRSPRILGWPSFPELSEWVCRFVSSRGGTCVSSAGAAGPEGSRRVCPYLCEWRPWGAFRRACGHVWGDVGRSEGRNSAAAAGRTSHRGVPACPHLGGQALKKKVESVLPAVEPSAQGGSPKFLFRIRDSMDPGSEHTFAT